MDTGAAAEEIPFQREVTATGDTSRRMAGAFLRWQLRAVRPIVLLPVVVAVAAIVVRGGPVSFDRLLGVAFWSAAFMFGAFGLLLAIAYVTNRRRFDRSIPAGASMRTGFGDDGFVSANVHSTTHHSYDSVTSIVVVDEFVLMRYQGSQVVHVFPAELFPPEVVDRLASEASPAPAKPPRWAVVALVVCLPLLLVLTDVLSRNDEPGFCSDLGRLDEPVAALRQAKASDEFDVVPERFADLAGAYRSIDPPEELRQDWATAIEFLRFAELSARNVISQGEALVPSAEADARFGAAMADITTYAVETCDDRVRSQLVP